MPSKYLSSLGRTLDARPDRLDLRDREYQPQLLSLPPRWPVDPDLATCIPEYVAAALVLDQGDQGACTGFGLAGLAGRVAGLEIHFIGHSAGAIVLGHLLDDLRANKLRAGSCSLFAPVCDTRALRWSITNRPWPKAPSSHRH
jgi:hypothetical protein